MCYVLFDLCGVSLWLQLIVAWAAGFTISPSVGLAYVADLVPQAGRASAFGLLLGSTSMALIIAPLLSTLMTQRVAFLSSFGTSVFSLCFTVLFVPEALAEEKRQQNRADEHAAAVKRALAAGKAPPPEGTFVIGTYESSSLSMLAHLARCSVVLL